MKDEITVGEAAASPPLPVSSPDVATSGKVNINTAGYEELQKVTGVGEVIAQRIIEHRQNNGPFQNIEEIKNVKGIGEKTFEKMKEEIAV